MAETAIALLLSTILWVWNGLSDYGYVTTYLDGPWPADTF